MNSLKKMDFIKKLRDSSQKKYDRMFTERDVYDTMKLNIDEKINAVNKSIKRDILESIQHSDTVDNIDSNETNTIINTMKPMHQMNTILSQNFQDIIQILYSIILNYI